MSRLAVRVCLCVAAWGCSEKDEGPPEPVATPVVDAAPTVDAMVADAEAEAALPTIVMGELQFETDLPPDGGAAKPKRRRGRRARPPKSKRVPARASGRPVSALRTIRSHWSEVEKCYGDVALKDPTVKGRIVMQWTLGADGMPTATAVVKDTLKDKSVGRCIKARARAWRFPKPSGGISVVTYPFDLRVQ